MTQYKLAMNSPNLVQDLLTMGNINSKRKKKQRLAMARLKLKEKKKIVASPFQSNQNQTVKNL